MDEHTGIPIVRHPSQQPPAQPYGDVTLLNTCRLVMDSVGKEVLADIMGDYLDLLHTSAAVYEQNGDYAQGLFTSGWCRKMDATSRRLCGTDDNREALQSGKWHCHESCWHTSKASIDTGAPADKPCHGGIRIYAVPIVAGGRVVGSINFGYGSPPQDPQQLREIADRYGLSVEELRREAAAYEPRPAHMVEIAKSRLQTAARLISEIIERKHVEEQLRVLNEYLEHKVAERTAKLEEAVKELEAFAYSVSHDLRAPLRHIGGFADLLHKHAAATLDEKGHRYLTAIAESVAQMGHLVDDLLAFSRIGRTELHQTTVNLNRLVEDVLQSLRQDTEGRTIIWTIGALPDVFGDAALLRQVLANLLGNAVKYTRPREAARIEIGSWNGAPGVCDETVVFVRDNGVGFDMRYAHKLFDVFQRLHSASEFEGTGIGLANVRRIVHRHGGRAWAEGSVNGGATFYVSLLRSARGRDQ